LLKCRAIILWFSRITSARWALQLLEILIMQNNKCHSEKSLQSSYTGSSTFMFTFTACSQLLPRACHQSFLIPVNDFNAELWEMITKPICIEEDTHLWRRRHKLCEKKKKHGKLTCGLEVYVLLFSCTPQN
jgi:hypothetical protein